MALILIETDAGAGARSAPLRRATRTGSPSAGGVVLAVFYRLAGPQYAGLGDGDD